MMKMLCIIQLMMIQPLKALNGIHTFTIFL
jgi:hypothetical protein